MPLSHFVTAYPILNKPVLIPLPPPPASYHHSPAPLCRGTLQSCPYPLSSVSLFLFLSKPPQSGLPAPHCIGSAPVQIASGLPMAKSRCQFSVAALALPAAPDGWAPLPPLLCSPGFFQLLWTILPGSPLLVLSLLPDLGTPSPASSPGLSQYSLPWAILPISLLYTNHLYADDSQTHSSSLDLKCPTVSWTTPRSPTSRDSLNLSGVSPILTHATCFNTHILHGGAISPKRAKIAFLRGGGQKLLAIAMGDYFSPSPLLTLSYCNGL